MADISDVKRFKGISSTDNILVKEIDVFKKSNYNEIADTSTKYIDIDGLIDEALSKRSVFFDTFLERGIYPYMRMVCDVQVLNASDKTVRLIQRPLTINNQLRFENIDIKYFDNAILEVYIESLPTEIVDRDSWRLEDIDTPLNIKFRRQEANNIEESYVLLSDLTLLRPLKYFYGVFEEEAVWSPFPDSFSGRVEAYASSTGVDGYKDFSSFTKDAYLRFVSSNFNTNLLEENISRSKAIDIRKNNISKLLYVEENPSASESRTLQGIDVELTVSTVPKGKGVDSLGCKLINKVDLQEDVPYRPGAQDIGTIKTSYQPRHFGLKEFDDGVFICASLDSDKQYVSKDFPEFVKKFNVRTNTFAVKDYVFKIQNPFNLPIEKFQNYSISHTTVNEEFGTVTPGKIGLSGLMDQLRIDRVTSDTSDLLRTPTNNSLPGVNVELDPNGIEVVTIENLMECFGSSEANFLDSPSIPKLFFSRQQGGTLIPVSTDITNRKPDIAVMFYVVVGFITT